VIRLLAAIAIVWSTTAWPCRPAPWIMSAPRDNPAAYAKALLAHTSALIHAKVVASGHVPATDLIGFADVEVLERFKGPRDIRRIFTQIRMATCDNPEFVVGEERLFALVFEESGKLFEMHSWRLSEFSDAALTGLLRVMTQHKLSK